MKILLGFLFTLTYLLSYSQDLIVKRDSSVIFCKIIKEDNAAIYYRQNKGEQTVELNIKKADVISYYNKAIVQNEIKRTDSLSLVKPKRDTVQIKKDTLPAKSMVITLKTDSLKPQVSSSKPKVDSIFLNVNYRCFYKGEQITRKEALGFMKRDTTAYKEMQKARGNFVPVIPLGLGAAILAGVFVGDAVSNGNFHWIVGGSCVIATALAITFKHNCNVHLYKAVKQYNANRDMAIISVPKFELGAASSGVGLCLKF
jgi:hypothetical protein